MHGQNQKLKKTAFAAEEEKKEIDKWIKVLKNDYERNKTNDVFSGKDE